MKKLLDYSATLAMGGAATFIAACGHLTARHREALSQRGVYC